MPKITPFLWFNDGAGDALDFYSKVFERSEVIDVSKVDAPEMPGGGFIMGTIQIENLKIMVFNGGPMFKFNESFSLFVSCADQGEVDYYWNALVEGGEPGQCGWLKDRFGLSWQIIPSLLGELMGGPDHEGAGRVREAMLQMTKIESAVLQAAYDG